MNTSHALIVRYVKSRGFTLVELLACVAISGILIFDGHVEAFGREETGRQ